MTAGVIVDLKPVIEILPRHGQWLVVVSDVRCAWVEEVCEDFATAHLITVDLASERGWCVEGVAV